MTGTFGNFFLVLAHWLHIGYKNQGHIPKTKENTTPNFVYLKKSWGEAYKMQNKINVSKYAYNHPEHNIRKQSKREDLVRNMNYGFWEWRLIAK